MKKYIGKDALLARIKKLKMDIGNIFNEYDEGFWEGRTTAFDDVICALDTLEVKEVDLEKEIGMFTTQTMLKKRNHSTGVFHLTQVDVNNIAKHFFELGMQQSKSDNNEEKNKLIAEIEKLKAESIQTLRNDNHKDSPEYYSAAGQASAYVKVLDLINELYDTRR